jgi:hypothetical protein
MDDIAQITVVGSRRVAHHGIDLCRLGYRQFWPRIEPRRGFGDPAAFPRELADDDRGFNPCAERRAGECAADQHSGMIDRLRQDVGWADPSQKLGQFTSYRHRASSSPVDTSIAVTPAKKAGVHLSAARAAGRWVSAFPTELVRGLKARGTADRIWFHPGRVGRRPLGNSP